MISIVTIVIGLYSCLRTQTFCSGVDIIFTIVGTQSVVLTVVNNKGFHMPLWYCAIRCGVDI